MATRDEPSLRQTAEYELKHLHGRSFFIRGSHCFIAEFVTIRTAKHGRRREITFAKLLAGAGVYK